jgi:hypothetical protein
MTLDNFAEHFNFKGLMSSVLCGTNGKEGGFHPKILHRFPKQAINGSGSYLDLN